MSDQNVLESERGITSYKRQLLKKYDDVKDTLYGGLLSNLTNGNIKEVIELRLKGDLKEYDVLILKEFFIENNEKERTVGIPLHKLVKKSNLEKYRPFVNFLKGGQDNLSLSKIYRVDLLAFILDFEPRPYVRFSNYKEDDSNFKVIKIPGNDLEEEKNTKSSFDDKETLKKPFFTKENVIIGLGIIALLLYILSSFTNLFTKENPNTIITDNSTNITIGNLDQTNYYYYTKPDGKIGLTDKLKLDEIDKNRYKPVTRKVLNTYFYQQGKDTTSLEIKNVINAKYLQTSGKIKDTPDAVETPKNTKQTKVTLDETKIIEKDTTSQVLVPEEKSVIKNSLSFQVVCQEDIDLDFLAIFEKKYATKYHIVTEDTAKTNFVCTGHVSYAYTKSPIRDDLVVCDITLNYEIKNTITNYVVKTSKRETVNGSGFSKRSAKRNALNKIKL